MSGAHLTCGSAADAPFSVVISPESAGWGFSGLRVLDLELGSAHAFATGGDELIVLPLSGSCSVTVDGEAFTLEGRDNVFSAVTDFVYAPRDAHVEIEGAGRFALPSARAGRRFEARYVPADAVPVELRGAGAASRQVNNFCSVDAFEADRLIAVEVLTPGGNWSSYPPHRHDELEEIYYYEVRDGGLSTLACTTSIGPGATNLVTGAALATINRLPVLLLPGDVFATRAAGTVLQELEDPTSYTTTVNDTLRPVSKFWTRVERAEQLAPALLAAMRVLTDPAETGAVTLALPQDVQAEAYEFPEELFARRVWRIRRPLPEPDVLAEAAALIRAARRPLIVSGGGTIYAAATEALRELAEATGIGVGETQAGKGSLRYDHPQALGAIGATGTTAANAAAREADVILGVGTRWTDFTTASRSLFSGDATFINLNVATIDAVKHAGVALVADAKLGLEALNDALDVSFQTPANDWDAVVERAYEDRHWPPAQAEVIGVVNRVSGPRDVVVCAAGSMPGDLHKLWRTRDPKGYHVEYGYSTMGYEIAGGLGVKMAAPDREVFVLVGDGSYLMMAQELATAVADGIKLTVVLVQNHGYQSIGALSESVGSQRFGTKYRYRDSDETLPVDLAANAASLGARAIDTHGIEEFETALREAAASDVTTVVQVHTDPLISAPSSDAWWDVPVAETAELDTTRTARSTYEANKTRQRTYLAPPHGVETTA